MNLNEENKEQTDENQEKNKKEPPASPQFCLPPILVDNVDAKSEKDANDDSGHSIDPDMVNEIKKDVEMVGQAKANPSRFWKQTTLRAMVNLQERAQSEEVAMVQLLEQIIEQNKEEKLK